MVKIYCNLHKGTHTLTTDQAAKAIHSYQVWVANLTTNADRLPENKKSDDVLNVLCPILDPIIVSRVMSGTDTIISNLRSKSKSKGVQNVPVDVAALAGESG